MSNTAPCFGFSGGAWHANVKTHHVGTAFARLSFLSMPGWSAQFRPNRLSQIPRVASRGGRLWGLRSGGHLEVRGMDVVRKAAWSSQGGLLHFTEHPWHTTPCSSRAVEEPCWAFPGIGYPRHRVSFRAPAIVPAIVPWSFAGAGRSRPTYKGNKESIVSLLLTAAGPLPDACQNALSRQRIARTMRSDESWSGPRIKDASRLATPSTPTPGLATSSSSSPPPPTWYPGASPSVYLIV